MVRKIKFDENPTIVCRSCVKTRISATGILNNGQQVGITFEITEAVKILTKSGPICFDYDASINLEEDSKFVEILVGYSFFDILTGKKSTL